MSVSNKTKFKKTEHSKFKLSLKNINKCYDFWFEIDRIKICLVLTLFFFKKTHLDFTDKT